MTKLLLYIFLFKIYFFSNCSVYLVLWNGELNTTSIPSNARRFLWYFFSGHTKTKMTGMCYTILVQTKWGVREFQWTTDYTIGHNNNVAATGQWREVPVGKDNKIKVKQLAKRLCSILDLDFHWHTYNHFTGLQHFTVGIGSAAVAVTLESDICVTQATVRTAEPCSNYCSAAVVTKHDRVQCAAHTEPHIFVTICRTCFCPQQYT